MKLDTVLVGVDFSSASLPAIRRALVLAGNGRVRLLNVVDTELMPHHSFIGRDLVERLYDELEREAGQNMAQLVGDLDVGEARVTSEIRRGRPADEIIEAASGADLVVVGAHARDKLGRLVLGSVAESVVRGSGVPTLVVREGGEGTGTVGRVLLAVDVSEPIDEAIKVADDLASRLGVELAAIHVIPWPVRLTPASRGDVVSVIEMDVESRIRDAAPRAVEAAIAKAIGKAAAIHVFAGSPAEEIIRHARKNDILVCGTHGRGALGRLAFGSVATKLVREAPCPVLVVRPAEKKAVKKAKPSKASAK